MTHDERVQIARLEERLISMHADLKILRSDVVGRAEFLPVKWIAYGLAGSVLLAVLGAVVKGVIA